jgi:hypothetical protein
MSISCLGSSFIYREAIAHCRAKTILKDKLKRFPSIDFFRNKTFKEIFILVWNELYTKYKIGDLTIYDITSGICRYYNIPITMILLVGKGPKRAIKLLSKMYKEKTLLSIKTIRIDTHKLKYVDIVDLQNLCTKLQLSSIPEWVYTTGDGDKLETWLCNWQKDFNKIPKE